MAFPLKYLFCFLLLTLLSSTTNAQTYSNVSLGSSLTAGNDNSSWLSPSGDFAFGFQQINNDGYLLAIWFNKIPEQTIVWSANRNDLYQRGSKVQLTTNGQLVLTDPSGKSIPSPFPVGNRISYAAMLDTGNFVLASNYSVYLWESFHHPTDTILPTQTLNQETQLVSRYSVTNYSDGRFKFVLQDDGNLAMYSTRYPFDTNNNAAYWATKANVGLQGYQVIYNWSGYVYLIAKNGSLLNTVFAHQTSSQDFYQRATVDFDGVFRQYVYPKSPASTSRLRKAWTTLSFIPSNICLAFRGYKGSGACGYNSYCTFDGETPSCQCPKGYVFIDSNDVRKGCKQNFVSQFCDETSQEADLFEFVTMPNMDWPLSDYELQNPVNEDQCRQACLLDCLCAVAIYNNEVQKCWKKRLPLSNGVQDPRSGRFRKALIKVRKNSSLIGYSKKKDQSTLFITGSTILDISVFLNALLLLTTCVCLFRRI